MGKNKFQNLLQPPDSICCHGRGIPICYRSPAAKKVRAEARADGGGEGHIQPLISSLPADVISKNLLPFWNLDEIRLVSHSSSALRSVLPTPRLVGAKRLPTKMAYEPWGGDFGTTCHQLQTFKFLVATDTFGISGWSEATLSLTNAVWLERHNRKQDYYLRPDDGPKLPGKTQIQVSVVKMHLAGRKHFKMKASGIKLFETLDPALVDCVGSEGSKDYGGLASEFSLPGVVQCLYLCAKWIESRPDLLGGPSACPSAKYVLQALPKSVHKHLPAFAGGDAEHWTAEAADRSVIAEWEYCPSPKEDDWYTWCLTPMGDHEWPWRRFGLPGTDDALPWYKDLERYEEIRAEVMAGVYW